VRLSQWSAYDSLRTLGREAQVDGVIRLLLGDAASNDTRQILITGSNPLAAADVRAANGLAQIVGLAIGAPEFQRR
jgi:hypothetical protein